MSFSICGSLRNVGILYQLGLNELSAKFEMLLIWFYITCSNQINIIFGHPIKEKGLD